MAVRPNGLDDEPQYKFDIDREKVGTLRPHHRRCQQTRSAAAWGSEYVNDFVDRGRIKRVFIQGDATFAHVTARLSTSLVCAQFAWARWSLSPPLPAALGSTVPPSWSVTTVSPLVEIQGRALPRRAAPGQPWTSMEGIAAQAAEAGISASIGRGFPMRRNGPGSEVGVRSTPSRWSVVFLCLAALYESWSHSFCRDARRAARRFRCRPGHATGAGWPTMSSSSVGLLTTIGLSAKNAILIVEFAKENYEEGMELVEATVRAAHQRLRPILMTSLAFVFGRDAAGALDRRGFRRPERHRHWRDRRHDRGDGFGGLLRAAILRGDAAPLQGPASQDPSGRSAADVARVGSAGSCAIRRVKGRRPQSRRARPNPRRLCRWCLRSSRLLPRRSNHRS